MTKSQIPKKAKIGLALGGGAVLGAAHVGILKAIDELGIEVSAISGTSIGALMAAFYAFGKNPLEVKEIMIDLSWRDISSLSLSSYGLFTNDKIDKLIEQYFGKTDFSEANIPLSIIATNIGNGKKAVLETGDLGKAVSASMAIPGVFQPVEIDGELLVDGGIVENVPVSPFKGKEVDFIIAVDLNAQHTYSEPKNIVGVLMNSFHFALSTASKVQTAKADLIIQPDLSAFNHIDVDQAEELMKSGYDAAMNELKMESK